MNDDFKSDRDIVMAFVKDNGYLLEHVSKDLRCDREVVKNDRTVYQYLNKKLAMTMIYGNSMKEVNMQMKGYKWFDLNHDGEISQMEQILGQSMMFSMIEEEEEEEQRNRLTSAGIDPDELEDMDDFEKYQALEDAGLDPSDFDL